MAQQARRTDRQSLEHASQAIDLLLNNDLASARALLSSADDDSSSFHQLAAGVCAFLGAALGMESSELAHAIELLAAAENGANKRISTAASTSTTRTDDNDGDKAFYAPATPFKVLVADAVILQSLSHVLTESYVEVMKAVYKLNRAYKSYHGLYKLVLPRGVAVATGADQASSSSSSDDNARLEALINAVNEQYQIPHGSSSVRNSSSGGAGAGGYLASLGWRSSRGNNTPSASGTSTPTTSSGGGGSLKHASSTNALTSSLGSLRLSSIKKPSGTHPGRGAKHPGGEAAASAPVSAPGSEASSRAPSVRGGVYRRSSSSSSSSDTPPSRPSLDDAPAESSSSSSAVRPLWADDKLATFVISGTAFGNGLFQLIFSMLPTKLRKLIGWLGFGSAAASGEGDRASALALLSLSAETSDDVHASFSALVLVTYFNLLLLMAGWQADRAGLLARVERVLGKVQRRYPNGTLWLLNRAKVARMRGETLGAIDQLKLTLDRDEHSGGGESFKQADALVVFELGWCELSAARYRDAGARFERMRDMNNWSHATYVWLALGCLISARHADSTATATTVVADDKAEDESAKQTRTRAQIDRLWNEMPSLMGKKRIMGEAPATELLITRKMAYYKQKRDRWVAQGRLPADASDWDAVKVSPAFEFGLLWHSQAHAPPEALEQQIAYLRSLSPGLGDHSNHSTGQSGSEEQSDLESPDELAMRDLLVGAMLVAMHSHDEARAALTHAEQAPVRDDTWVAPFAAFQLGIVDCRDADELASRGERAKARDKLAEAGKRVGVVFDKQDYLFKSRLESRVNMLRDEIATRRASLA